MIALAELIDAHRGAFEYDWRSRFQLSLTVVGRSMTWGEAVRLVRLLRVDPSSAVCAALEGWEHTASREVLALYDLFDLEHAVNSKKTPKPHTGRPGKKPEETHRRGNAGGRTASEVMAIMSGQFGHAAPV